MVWKVAWEHGLSYYFNLALKRSSGENEFWFLNIYKKDCGSIMFLFVNTGALGWIYKNDSDSHKMKP